MTESVSQVTKTGTSISAFWISPDKYIVNVPTSHIAAIIKHPNKFSLQRLSIETLYGQYAEPLGLEGKAREKIIIDLIKKRWVRIRSYSNKGWSITIDTLTPGKKDIICQWANLVLSGINGFKEIDPYMPVNIIAVAEGNIINHIINDIAEGKWEETANSYPSHHNKDIIVLDSYDQLPDL